MIILYNNRRWKRALSHHGWVRKGYLCMRGEMEVVIANSDEGGGRDINWLYEHDEDEDGDGDGDEKRIMFGLGGHNGGATGCREKPCLLLKKVA